MDTITIGDSSVSPSGSARNFGVIFDKTLCLHDHRQVCQPCHYWLKTIRRVRRCLNLTATQLLVQAFVLSRLNYCNALYVGLPQQQLGQLQRIQKAAARLITCTSRIIFKILTLTFLAIHGKAPTYYVSWSSSTPCDVNYGRRAMHLC